MSKKIFKNILFFCILFSAQNSRSLPLKELRILAKVGTQAVSSRQVIFDIAYENPNLYKSNQELWVSWDPDIKSRALQRVILERMIVSENALLRTYKVSAQEVVSAKRKWESSMGAQRFKLFKQDVEASDMDVDDFVRAKLVVQKAIEDQVKISGNQKDKALQDWIEKLRSRYKVQLMEKGT